MAVAVGLIIAWPIILPAPVSAQPEDKDVPTIFLETWEKAAQTPDKAVSLWQKFAEANDTHDLGRLAKLLAGIELLRTSEDKTDLNRLLPYFEFELQDQPASPDAPQPSYLLKQIAAAGQGLTARVRMWQLGQKLQEYYRKHIEYPQTLDELVAEGFTSAAEVIDPFGQPFAYQSKARKIMPDLPRQTFSLRCLSIDAELRDLDKCFSRIAKPTSDVLLGSLVPQSHRAYVKRMRPDGAFGESKAWTVGGTSGDLVLWAVYDSYVIAAWKQFPIVLVKQ